MSAKDHPGFYYAGAKALKILAAGCGEARLAQIFENQAQRFLRLAQNRDPKAGHPGSEPRPPMILVRAKRPNFSPRGTPAARPPRRGPAMVVDLATARDRRGC